MCFKFDKSAWGSGWGSRGLPAQRVGDMGERPGLRHGPRGLDRPLRARSDRPARINLTASAISVGLFLPLVAE